MLRPRARVGRAPVAVRRPALVPGLLVALLLPLGGCGSAEADETDQPSAATLSCREQWSDLEAAVEGRDSSSHPSALASRWTTILATVDYYATSARASDCGRTVSAQEKAMDDLAAFGTRLAPYDVELRLEQVQQDAGEYAAGPTPPAPEPGAEKKGRKRQKRTPAPPTPDAVAQSLKTLTAQAPVASQEQGPGWQQAAVADLADTAATAKTVKDLAFLSSESPAYRACSLALAQIGAALNPVTTR
jgi:hypothetical protein